MNKRENNKDRLLRLMRDGRWYHMAALRTAGGWRYGARLFELKKQGWEHERRSVGEDAFEYRLYSAEAKQLALV